MGRLSRILDRGRAPRCPLCGSPLVRDAEGRLACPRYGVVGDGLPESEAFEHFPANDGRRPAADAAGPGRSAAGLDLEALAWRVLGGRK